MAAASVALDAASVAARPVVFAVSRTVSVIDPARLRLCDPERDCDALAPFLRLPLELLRLELELARFAPVLRLEPVAFRRVPVRLLELLVFLVDCATLLPSVFLRGQLFFNFLRAACRSLLPSSLPRGGATKREDATAATVAVEPQLKASRRLRGCPRRRDP